MERSETLPKRPWIVAHRGARAEAPENTAAAFERAIACGADGVEFDVQMSRDGALVLFHDRTLKKISGSRRCVADLTRETLGRLDAGAWFSHGFAGERIAGFRQTVKMLAGRTRMLVEIKVFKSDRRSRRSEQLTEKVLQILDGPDGRQHRHTIRILSFDPDVIRHASKIAPQHRYVLDLTRADAKRIQYAPSGLLDRLGGLGIPCSRITSDLVDWAHGRQMEVFAYTCNDAATLKRLLAAGTDGILTDDPCWLAEELDSGGRP